MESTVTIVGKSTADTHFMWLEITGNCQLECSHCYAGSGPGQGHGAITADQWIQTLTEASANGVQHVQFIGGEPTSHPALPRLISHAREVGMQVEVFSNLVSIRDRVWEALAQPGVSLATSYYSSDADVHDKITQRNDSHGRTRANIGEAVQRGIAIRIGLTQLFEDQNVAAAIEELVALGVDRDSINVDDLRGVGRGRDSGDCNTEDELCGNCAGGVLAVMPDGAVQPCVFSRDERFHVGNVATDSLTSVLNGHRLQRMREDLTSAFVDRGLIGVDCSPAEPLGSCPPACSPSCIPMGNCNPIVNPAPPNPRPEPPVRPPGPVCSPY